MDANFKDIEMAFDFANFGQPFENEAYLNLRTGETQGQLLQITFLG